MPVTRNPEAKSGCKQSIYFTEDDIQKLDREAKRLDRSISWVVQRCISHGGLRAVQGLPADARAAE